MTSPPLSLTLTQLRLHGFDHSLLDLELRQREDFVLLTLAPGTVPGTPEALNKCLWSSWVKRRLGEGGGVL